jgi:2-phosphoglycerate kinase
MTKETPESLRGREPGDSERADRVMVEDARGQRPFMRGIMVHSLMARGIEFNQALAAADGVRDRIRGCAAVPRKELTKIIEEILGEEALGDDQPPLPTPLEVRVEGEGGSWESFSKGALSQSLLAAALDPNDAFDVAREIELQLLQRGHKTVRRDELRHLAFETLQQRFGPRTATRYRVWRHFETPERPVIILLGGATGSGKTSLALEVALRLGISRVLSTDSIRQVMRIMLSPELMPEIHASSFDSYRHLNINPTGEGPVVGGFMAQATAVSVGVRGIIDRAIEENTSLVLDGVSLVPGLIDLESYADRAHVIYLVVARLDDSAFREHFESRGNAHGYRSANRYVDNLGAILKIQDHILELADQENVPIVDNVNLDGSVLLIIRHVVETLRKQGDFDEL